ncbi:Protein PAM71, chloroplastic [Cucurbita argyrosperma subsp. argyrosperma]|nr:Protein PAM71, chloroplastic [Cucurbita argyrosperma subsp. argyrosperma]
MPGSNLSHLTFHPPSSFSASPRSVASCLVSLNSPCRRLSSNFSLPIVLRKPSCSLISLGSVHGGTLMPLRLIFELKREALLAARNSAAIGNDHHICVLGRTFHHVDEILAFRLGEIDLPVDDIAAVCLLVYFGVSTLLDASSSDGLKAEDEQKEAEIAVTKFSGNTAASTVISTFVLVFVAEWGDKSFFSTIALAAASSPLGVIGGALAGHGVATLLAVLGGSLLGTFLSEKIIAYVGGVLFLVFAAITLIEIVN